MRRAPVLSTLLLLTLTAPLAARAWPVDMALQVDEGAERFHKLTAVDWVEVRDASVATVEVLAGSNELLMTGLKPGRTLVLLYAEGKFGVWRLTVTKPGARPEPEDSKASLEAARKACPGLQARQAPERSLVVTVKDSACRVALRELLRTDAFLARELELTFELTALQEQLAAVTPALQSLGLEARYSGAGVVLTGRTTPERHRKALWALFHEAVGRVPLDDESQRSEDAPPPEDKAPQQAPARGR